MSWVHILFQRSVIRTEPCQAFSHSIKHNEERHDVPSSNNIRTVTLTADGWGMLHAWEAKLLQFVAGQLEEKDHLEDLGIDRSMVLKWILRNGIGGGWRRGVCGLDSSSLCQGTVAHFMNTVVNIHFHKIRGIV